MKLNSHRKFKKVTVLMGGFSLEREVSLATGTAVVSALNQIGYETTAIDVQYDIIEQLIAIKPDAVFNALHGKYGEDGCIQGILEILHIPYTHSGVLASAIAMNKLKSMDLFRNAGLPCPNSKILARDELIRQLPQIMKPYVIKPINEGSSIGVNIVLEHSSTPTEENIFNAHHLLLEEYIPGKELSVAVTDNEPLGVIEIEPHSKFFDYQHKYEAGFTTHYMPARIEQKIYDQAMDIAFKAHHLIGCSAISRSDFRFNPESGKIYILEINQQPGLTSLSLVPEIAQYRNISFPQLVEYIVENAACGK